MATRGKNNAAYLQSVRMAQKIREEESYECTQSVAGGGGGGGGGFNDTHIVSSVSGSQPPPHSSLCCT
jgi:hypothetical protein